MNTDTRDNPRPWDDPDSWDDEAHWSTRAQAVGPAASLTVGDPQWTVDVLAHTGKANAMLAWIEYREIGAMHSRLVAIGKPEASARGVRMLDIETQAAARIAMSRGITQNQGDRWLAEAIAMRDRIPAIGRCLREGIISPRQFRLAVSRTELIDGQDWSETIDRHVAAALRSRTGTWSNKRLTDLIDRIIFRHDPDAVRRRHENAKEARTVWILPGADGIATLGATMTAQDANIALGTVFLLADRVCGKDPRSESARRCDALFALMSGSRFECDCGTDDCTADIPEPDALAQWVAEHRDREVATGRVLVHVIADRATVDGRNDEPAFMDGHGVISAAHLRDLLARDDTTVRDLNPASGDKTGTSLPTHLPSDPYRPSTALNTFVRARDGYCTIPGCDRPAWRCDIDHVAEYDHADPAAGGQTTPDGLAAKCRMHHNLKTFGSGWIDDQYRDGTGRLVSEVVSPEGLHFPGPAETNSALFPGLDMIRWHQPAATGPNTADDQQRHRPPRDRTRAKHARRRFERQANRRRRLAEEALAEERDLRRRREQPCETDGDPPF
ncbi:HNH endonuclease signature motif containing protein [Gordonia crocea]|uniref:DUF222 domain-containing protein n=1 Tax=Gordonia crocea TaxID=589162 RepID=A0A7I9UWM3_9ACTN|nr:HNH endonuclease signature motif containing protein [Gordonia crocea]GED97604.1 hypothetical protein nbrc107697_16430 [Gordonia crocea]